MSTEPEECHVCGRRATGIAVGKSPRWLCKECVPLLEYVKDIRRLDPYELRARHGGVEAMGAVIERYGPNLDEYTEEQALMLAGAAWRGCADEVRRLIRSGDAPF